MGFGDPRSLPVSLPCGSGPVWAALVGSNLAVKRRTVLSLRQGLANGRLVERWLALRRLGQGRTATIKLVVTGALLVVTRS